MIKTAVAANPYIEQLKDKSTQDVPQVDYLIIAHPDDRMVTALKSAFSEYQLAILTIPQFGWDMSGDAEQEVVQWAVEELNVKGVLLVGHSQGGFPNEQVQLFNGSSDRQSASGRQGNPLLERVRQAQAALVKSEQHFVDQLQGLVSLPSLSEKTLRDPSWIQGLFYRAESGIFCLVDPQSGSFQALINDSCIA